MLQGLPGCGKSAIAKNLMEKLSNPKYIEVDKFKLKAISEGKTWAESQRIAYRESLDLIDKYNSEGIDYLILDELFSSNEFISMLNRYSLEKELVAYWFKIDRPMEELLEIEKRRQRRIKNSIQDFLNLQRAIDKIRVKNQFHIKNSQTIDIDKSVGQILGVVLK